MVVRAGQYAGAVAAEEALQVAVVDVAKEHRFVWRCGGNAKIAGRGVLSCREHGGGVAAKEYAEAPAPHVLPHELVGE